jgi:hypothetical protein
LQVGDDLLRLFDGEQAGQIQVSADGDTGVIAFDPTLAQMRKLRDDSRKRARGLSEPAPIAELSRFASETVAVLEMIVNMHDYKLAMVGRWKLKDFEDGTAAQEAPLIQVELQARIDAITTGARRINTSLDEVRMQWAAALSDLQARDVEGAGSIPPSASRDEVTSVRE